MRLEKISIGNIRRHFSRLALLVMGLTIAVATVVTLYTISTAMKVDFQKKVDEFGTNMVIVPRTKNLSLSYAGVTLGGFQYQSRLLEEADIAKLKTIKNAANLAIIAPKLLNIAQVKGKNVMVVGVDFPKELKIKKWWEIAQGEKPTRGFQALLGAKAAKLLKVRLGENLRIKGRQFKVAGVLQTVGSQEDDLLYLDLKKAQSLFNQPKKFSLIEVAAWCYNCPIEQIVGQTNEKLPHAKASAVLQVAKNRNAVVDQFIAFSLSLSLIMIIVASLVVFTNTLSAVRERRREIGIFRAIGFRRLNILEIILFETVIVGFLAGLLGYLLGFGAATILAPEVGLAEPINFDPLLAYFAVLGTMILALLSSLYPALKASNLSPMIAINDI